MRLTLTVLVAAGVVVGGVTAHLLRFAVEAGTERTDRGMFRSECRDRLRTVLRDDLRGRLAELEKRLAETKRRTAAVMEPALAAARKPFDADALAVYQREHNPEAYAQRTNSIVRHAIMCVKSREEDLALLSSVDASRWETSERAAFEEYVELSDYIARYEAMLAEMRVLDPELPASYGYDGIGREIGRRSELQCDVRYRLMAEAAKLYGLSETDAMDLADVAHRVVECTLSYAPFREERERNEARHRKLEEDASTAEGGAR